jgi:hypothetical protein
MPDHKGKSFQRGGLKENRGVLATRVTNPGESTTLPPART